MKLKIAVNKSCRNKESQPAHDWLNISEELEWLLGWVSAGYGWTATHFVDRHRKAENSCGSNMVVIDIDGDTTLARFWSTDTARHWCAATYTSSSHSEQEHRFRALFPLSMELQSPAQHKGAYWLIVDRLLAELSLEQLADNCGQKAERLWYGNTGTEVQINKEYEPVPQFLLESIDYQEDFDFAKSDVTDIDVKRCQWLLQHFLRPSEDGEYEEYYVPVLAACAGIGEQVFDHWVTWVLKGHHGEKPENILPFKWRGLGNYSGPTTLYSLAKKQDANWTSSLPSELRFRAAGTAVGYTEVDPLVSFDEIISHNTESMDNVIELEPLPDATQATRKRGRPKRSGDDAAKEREADVQKVKDILHDLRKNELTGSIEYTDATGKTIILQGNDLDLMTTKMACEHGVFIPEPRIKSAIQYAAQKNQYCPIRRYLDHCGAHAKPHPDWTRLAKCSLATATLLQHLQCNA